MMWMIAEIILYACGAYLLANAAWLLFFAIAGYRYQAPAGKTGGKRNRFCVLMPVYQNDEVIMETAPQALKHHYDGSFDVVVIADHLQPATVQRLRDGGVKVMEVQFENSTKGRAMEAVMNQLNEDDYDAVLVLDVDNVMETGVLNRVNAVMQQGFRAVQVHRTAKNLDTPFAFLDACNEGINNHLFRKGPFAAGLSSALIGSGMAFDFGLLKETLQGIGGTVGEDKELDFRLAGAGERIAYVADARVLDEKIADAGNFSRQRSRWISAQVAVAKKYTAQLFRSPLSAEYVNKLYQAWLVPRMILLPLLAFFLLVSVLLPAGPSPLFWTVLLATVMLSLGISLPAKYYRHPMFRSSLLALPLAIFSMIGALLRVNRVQGMFMPTKHQTVSTSKD